MRNTPPASDNGVTLNTRALRLALQKHKVDTARERTTNAPRTAYPTSAPGLVAGECLDSDTASTMVDDGVREDEVGVMDCEMMRYVDADTVA